MSRAFLICPEPVRQRTAGVGTRFLTLAAVLANAGHRVTLAVPNDPAEGPELVAGIEMVQAEPDRLGAQADGHDWVLVHAHLGNHYLAQRDDQPVVVDLYDPFLIENLHYYVELGSEPFVNDHATWVLQLGRGDLFLCSSPEQRLYYLGWLTALGRVNPMVLADDPELERLIVELPFAVPEGAPPTRPERDEVLPGMPEGAPVIYFGGIYDWYDPVVAVEAMDVVLAEHPDTVLVFVEAPNPETTPLARAEAARREAARRGWIGSSVRFAPWQPFERRWDLPLLADLAVVTHRAGLETELSLRTRLVDLLWLGVPVVTTAGGTMARVVDEIGAGVAVPPADPDAVAEAVLDLLGDQERRTAACEAGRGWAAGRTWPVVARPLLEFANRPWRDPHRRACPATVGPRRLSERAFDRLRRWRRRWVGR